MHGICDMIMGIVFTIDLIWIMDVVFTIDLI